VRGELKGRGAAVTGAASGIGLAIATRFSELGLRVVLADIDGDGAERAAQQLRTAGGEAHGVVVDVADAESVDAFAAHADELVGPVQVLVNNAGVVTGGPTWEIPLSEWHRVIDVNLWGVVHGIRAFVPRMIEAGAGGHVVNIGSMASVVPHAGLSPYVASKHAVLGISDALRAELAANGSGVGVTLVMPGRVRTGMVPEGAPAADVAEMVVAAIGDDRPYVFTDPTRIAEVEARFARILQVDDPAT
jgi:NAD(P)-dependent dehydrogenase (short-subunit alcohol dehydrogenase family)